MDQDVWNRDDGYLAQGARMVGAAVVSAVLAATLVIAVGQSVIQRHSTPASTSPSTDAVLIRASH